MDATKMKILIVEDHEIVSKVLQYILKKLGFNDIDCAADWHNAIKLFIHKNYDLIFMDVGLPDIDGLQLACLFRILERTKKHISIIIAATGYDVDSALLEECQQNGINNAIQKPYRIEDVKSALTYVNINFLEDEKNASATPKQPGQC